MRTRIVFLLAVMLPLAAAGCSSDSSSPMSPSGGGAGGTPVSIVRGAEGLATTAYAPNPLTVATGATVTWTNNDVTAHTATGDDGSWNSGNIAPGASFSRTFATAGTFTYHCTIHPNMIATVTVQ